MNTKALPETSAQSLGARAVDQTAAASFKLEKTDKLVRSRKMDRYFTQNKRKYRKSRKKGAKNVFVEKSGSRIDTAGELMGISAKGWSTQRKRKTKKRTPFPKLL